MEGGGGGGGKKDVDSSRGQVFACKRGLCRWSVACDLSSAATLSPRWGESSR